MAVVAETRGQQLEARVLNFHDDVPIGIPELRRASEVVLWGRAGLDVLVLGKGVDNFDLEAFTGR